MTTWTVPPEDLPHLSGIQSPPMVRDGDRVEVQAGTHNGQAHWQANDLHVSGVGGPAVFPGIGAPSAVWGKGMWVVSGARMTGEDITIFGVRDLGNPDARCGIRQEGRDATYRRILIHDCEDGILTNPDPASTLTLEDSEFHSCGTGGGSDHNLYISAIKALVMTGCRSHHARVGHNVKSRAAATTLERCNVYDAHDGTSSYPVDIPNGGVAVLRDCRIQKGPATENNSAVVNYGSEGLVGSTHTLLLERCLLTNDLGAALGSFVRTVPGTEVRMRNCVVVGPGALCNLTLTEEVGTVRLDQEPQWPVDDPYGHIATGTWGTLPGTAMLTVLQTDDPPPPGVEGWSGVFSYGGGDLDTAAEEYVHPAIGGHAAQSWNGIVAFHYRRARWRMRRTTTRIDASVVGNVGRYPDGSPSSRHTYGGVCDMEDGRLWMSGGAVWKDGGADNLVWHVGEDFSLIKVGPWIGPGCVSGWDRGTRRVIHTGQQMTDPYGGRNLWAYDPATGHHDRLCDVAGPASYHSSGVMDHARRHFYILEVEPADPRHGLYRYDLTAPQVQGVRVPLTGDPADLAHLVEYMNPGLDIDGDRLLVLVPAGLFAIDVLTGAVTQVGPPIPGVQLHEVGTYKRFRVLPALGVALLVNRVDQDVFAFRLRGGVEPPPEVPMRAYYVGRVPGHVGETPTPTPDPIPNDVFQLDRANPVRVEIHGGPGDPAPASGLWITPYNGLNWPVQVQGDHLQIKAYGPFTDWTVVATFADGSVGTAHVEPLPPDPPPSGLTPEEALAQAKAYTDAQIASLRVTLA